MERGLHHSPMLTRTDYIVFGYLILVVVVGFGLDAWLLAKGGEPNTISFRLTIWSKKYPILAVIITAILCTLAGHLWFPNHANCP